MRSSAVALALFLTTAATLPAAAQDAKAPPAAAAPALPDSLKDPQAQVSYAIGMNVGAGLKRDSIAIDPAVVSQGIKDALAGKPQITDEQMRAVLTKLQADVVSRREEKAVHAAETNKAEGEAFLKANAAKPGVKTLPSGLQYEVLTEGKGVKPEATQVVLCNYRGTLLDGTEFDSSYKRGAPDTFPVSGVIKGWTEALQRMPIGSKWRIYVPSNLAYGTKGAGPDIGPNAVLIFDIELLAVQTNG